MSPSWSHAGYPCDSASGWILRLKIWLFFSYEEPSIVPRLHFTVKDVIETSADTRTDFTFSVGLSDSQIWLKMYKQTKKTSTLIKTAVQVWGKYFFRTDLNIWRKLFRGRPRHHESRTKTFFLKHLSKQACCMLDFRHLARVESLSRYT